MSSTFDSRLLAEKWALRARAEIEKALADGLDFDPATVKVARNSKSSIPEKTDASVPSVEWTLKEALNYYGATVSASKKSAVNQLNLIKHLSGTSLGGKQLKEITSLEVKIFIDNLKNQKNGKPSANVTKRNYAFFISGLFKVAGDKYEMGGWNLNIKNPVKNIKLPEPPKSSKQRRITDKETNLIIQELIGYRQFMLFFQLAVNTGMRRSEILSLKWGDIKEGNEGYIIKIEESKSGYSRIIYLNDKLAYQIQIYKEDLARRYTEENEEVEDLDIIADHIKIFKFSKDYASKFFKKIAFRAGLDSTRLHDLRHTAVSNYADAGLTLQEIMSQSGHRSPSLISRYMHVSESAIRKKI
ncbi:MAG: site-specific integrase [Acidocella sp.]|nr:site-specific integrase [Acidocella sp.]